MCWKFNFIWESQTFFYWPKATFHYWKSTSEPCPKSLGFPKMKYGFQKLVSIGYQNAPSDIVSMHFDVLLSTACRVVQLKVLVKGFQPITILSCSKHCQSVLSLVICRRTKFLVWRHASMQRNGNQMVLTSECSFINCPNILWRFAKRGVQSCPTQSLGERLFGLSWAFDPFFSLFFCERE